MTATHSDLAHSLDMCAAVPEHRDVRTTLTLDEDVAVELRTEAKRTGLPLNEVVNRALRATLQRRGQLSSTPFKVQPRDLGDLMPGISLDNIANLLQQFD